ncbi:BACON domain-containing protein [Dysgonomonas termitidis]
MATKQKIIITGIEDGVAWQAVSNQEWLKVTDIVATAVEDSFNVSVDPNSASEVRTGIVTVIPSDNGTNGLVNVSQQGAVIYTLSISPTTKSSPAAGETFAITVTSNTSWTVSLPGWCTANVTSGTGNGTINVTVTGNTGGQRIGNIVVTAGTLNAACAVTQAAYVAPNISISPTTRSSPAAGETFTITVTSNTSWTVSLPGWCTANVMSGTGNRTVNVTVAGNTGSLRTGTITAVAGTATATCTLAQDGVATNPVISLINGNSLATVTAIVVLYPGSYNWNDSFQYNIPPGATYNNVSRDHSHGDFMAGSDYMIYWKGGDGTSGSTYAPDLQNGSAYSVG